MQLTKPDPTEATIIETEWSLSVMQLTKPDPTEATEVPLTPERSQAGPHAELAQASRCARDRQALLMNWPRKPRKQEIFSSDLRD
jgi:hypothetical protein